MSRHVGPHTYPTLRVLLTQCSGASLHLQHRKPKKSGDFLKVISRLVLPNHVTDQRPKLCLQLGPPMGPVTANEDREALELMPRGKQTGMRHTATPGESVGVGPSCLQPSDRPGAVCPGPARPPPGVPRFQGQSGKILAEPESSLLYVKVRLTRHDLLKGHTEF